MILILIILALLIAEAKYESVHGDRHGIASNLVLFLTAVMVELIGVSFFDFKYGLVLYVGYRFAFFDYLFSYFRYGYIWYLGKTSTIDRIQIWIQKITTRLIFNFAADGVGYIHIYRSVSSFYKYFLLVLRFIVIFAITIYLI